MQQFILTFRKLFGISSFVGLADSDRFELSGKVLEHWLSEPGECKNILVKNLGGHLSHHEEALLPLVKEQASDSQIAVYQPPLTEPSPAPRGTLQLEEQKEFRPPVGAQALEADDLGGLVRSLVLGLGFEERTEVGVRRILDMFKLEEGLLIRYPRIAGDENRVESLINLATGQLSHPTVLQARPGIPSAAAIPSGPVLIDITGLTKGLIFRIVREVLIRDGIVFLALTGANEYYPLEEDIRKVLDTAQSADAYEMLRSAAEIWSGEYTPYRFERLLRTDSDDSRRRLLCAAASPKHERLLSLLDQRSYDQVDVLVPIDNTPRARLATLAADVATKGIEGSRIEAIDTRDLSQLLDYIFREYGRFYVQGGFDVELALTGNKLHAAACAGASAFLKFAQAWYVRPTSFDTQRFSSGAGTTRYFKMSSHDT